jgi:hypothetical protein
VARLDLPDLDVASIHPLRVAPKTYFGVSAVAEGGKTYVFGVDERTPGVKGLLVARVTGDLTAGRWAYWDGLTWSRHAAHARPVLRLTASQFSVVREAGGTRLRLVVQDAFGSTVRSFSAPVAVGPWAEEAPLATIPSIPGAFTYNTAVHPEFGDDDTLLLSYCVNADGSSSDGVLQPDLYRPRFLAVPGR